MSDLSPQCEPGRRKSVTELPYSLTSCGTLPPDLNAALNLAVDYCGAVRGILEFGSQLPHPLDPQLGLARKMVRTFIECSQFEYPYHYVLKHVTNELTAVSDPTARFGATNAHEAALQLESRVMGCVWRAADWNQWIRCSIDSDSSARMDVSAVGTNFDAVRQALTAEKWPDANAISTACQIEAAKAALARGWKTKPADPYADLRLLASGLSKQERAVIEALCDAGGKLNLADVKALCAWLDPIESAWNSLRIRLNKKLKSHRWQLQTKGRAARLTKSDPEQSA